MRARGIWGGGKAHEPLGDGGDMHPSRRVSRDPQLHSSGLSAAAQLQQRIWDTNLYPWRTICSLIVRFPKGPVQIGTGALIGPRIVATAGHVVYDSRFGGWAENIEVTPGMNGMDERPFGWVRTRLYRTTAGWVNEHSAASDALRVQSPFDYGVVVLPEPIDAQLGLMPFEAWSDASLVGLSVNIAGYPAQAQPSGSLWWNANDIESVSAGRLSYSLRTVSGESGAPIFHYNHETHFRMMVGIHTSFTGVSDSAVRINGDVLSNLNTWMEEFA